MAVHRARGTRDFLPEQMHERLFVLDTLARVFREHGFEPLDTPAFERIETLTGKYGDEGDKLIYRILERGEGGREGGVDLALRYDLTVPLARVVAMTPDLRLPFKRFHMGPVWRADRPARGRFREFWQCDVDIVGSTSTLAEAECIAVQHRALDALGFGGVVFHLNDRRLLRAIARHLGIEDREASLLVAVDKLDRIGVEGVTKELAGRGFEPSAIEGLWSILLGDGDPLERLAHALSGDEDAARAVADVRQVVERAVQLGCPADRVRVEPTLARGLDYYTGPIWELVLPDADMGSVGGGGRYDGLIGMFSGRDVPAVGAALGLERLLVLREEGGAAVARRTSAPVLITIYDSERPDPSLVAARVLRDAGIGADVHTEPRKLKAQLKYADQRGYRFVAVIGPDEDREGTVTLKELASGEQVRLPLDGAAGWLRGRLQA